MSSSAFATTYQVTHTYDNAGRTLTKSFPSAPAENITFVVVPKARFQRDDAIASGNKGKGRLSSTTHEGGSVAMVYDARGRLATVSQDGNLKGTYQYNSLEQLASRAVTNAGAFNGTVHTTQDRAGNVIAEADGTTGIVAKESIWLPGAGYAGTDLPVGVVDVAGTATGTALRPRRSSRPPDPPDGPSESHGLGRRVAAVGWRAFDHRFGNPERPVPRSVIPSRIRLALQLA